MQFLMRESVTISLLFTSFALYLAASSPSVFANVLVVVGLVHVWAAILVMTTDRL